MDEEVITPETPIVETPVETPVVETPVTPPVEEPVTPPVTVPDGYVPQSEVETAREQLAAAETARALAETARDDALTEARNTQINAIAARLGFNDPADAARFLDAEATDIEAALTEVLATKSYLGKQEAVTPPVTVTNPTNPARPEALTLESIKTMTPAQINDRWADVKLVLQSGAGAV